MLLRPLGAPPHDAGAQGQPAPSSDDGPSNNRCLRRNQSKGESVRTRPCCSSRLYQMQEPLFGNDILLSTLTVLRVLKGTGHDCTTRSSPNFASTRSVSFPDRTPQPAPAPDPTHCPGAPQFLLTAKRSPRGTFNSSHESARVARTTPSARQFAEFGLIRGRRRIMGQKKKKKKSEAPGRCIARITLRGPRSPSYFVGLYFLWG